MTANIRKLPRLIYQLSHGEEQLALSFIQDLLASEGVPILMACIFFWNVGKNIPVLISTGKKN
ncbi:MAG: hypothetical protein IPP67_03935 [Rhodospirillaceae bacterium]|nr:hypothetical protein [Rhodospirillaceae bacterium]